MKGMHGWRGGSGGGAPMHHGEGQVLGSQVNRSQRKTPQVHVIREHSKPIPGIPRTLHSVRISPAAAGTGTSCATSVPETLFGKRAGSDELYIRG